MKKSCYKQLFTWLLRELEMDDDINDVEKCHLLKIRVLALKLALEQLQEKET